MLGMGYPRRAQLLLLLLLHQAAHLCLVSLGGAAGLSFSYDFSIPNPGFIHQKDFTYIGTTDGHCGNAICLDSANVVNNSARVVYAQPVRMWDGFTGKRASFNTSFSFAMGGGVENPNSTQIQGPGIAFFIGPFPTSLPPNSGGRLMGLFSDDDSGGGGSPRTVGVEFDAHWDSGYDPDDVGGADHVGIDVNQMSSGSYTRDLAKGDLFAGTVAADVTYDAGSNLMVVTVRLANGSKTSISELVILKQEVPQHAAVGFSAAKGTDLGFSPILISWSFSSTDPSIPLWVIILSSIASALLAALVVGALLFFIMRKRCNGTTINIELIVAKEFSYQELSASTNSFSEDRKLGEGSFGKVYRGALHDPRMPPVAVKVLTRPMDPQTRKHYVTEVTTLGQLSHQNLVKLVGGCTGNGNGNGSLLVVYELVTNRSLDEHLHGPERLLAWPERYQAVLDVGFAIEYLHTGKKEPILHRDIKPANVMLDDAFRAKLGDFGLVRQVDPGQGSLGGTTMIGSTHYMDPTCVAAGTVGTASDMYSFGVLLLEIATGKRPHASLDPEAGFPNSLVNAVREAYRKGAVLEMADARLDGDFDESQMRRVLLVGLLCVQLDRKTRPEIREAIYCLKHPSHPLPQIGVV